MEVSMGIYETIKELQKIFDSIRVLNGNELKTRLRKRSAALHRHSCKPIIEYNYIPVMARNLPYQRRTYLEESGMDIWCAKQMIQ